MFAKPLEMLNQDICNFYEAHAVYADYGGIVFAEEEGRNIARALGEGNKVSFLSVSYRFCFNFLFGGRGEGKGEANKRILGGYFDESRLTHRRPHG